MNKMLPFAFAILSTVMVSAAALAQPTSVQPVAPAGKNEAEKADAPQDAARRVPDTLMFTVDELTDIQNRLKTTEEEADSERSEEAIENAALYLSTIVYYGPQDWTIWVNNKPIGPTQDFSSFKITDIGPRYVELVVPLSANGMRPVRLEPNQTFISKSGNVVEGVWKP